VAWPLDQHSVDGTDLARHQKSDAYLVVGWDWGSSGPAIWAHTGAQPAAERSEIGWPDLARVLGRPAPFWPDRLRKADLILAWRPGDLLVRDVAVPAVDVEPLTRMALLYPPEHLAHRAMIATAQLISNRSDASDSSDLSILSERLHSDWGLHESDIVLAAAPASNVALDLPEQDQAVTRAGWLEVLGRADRLAEQCVRVLREWDGGRLWPYSQVITITRSDAGREFLARLDPAAERTAVFVAIDRDHVLVPMIDPATDIPVAVPADEHGEARALAPQRLPTTSPLAEVILDHPIWIRTADGTLYPAPLDRHAGLNWGYGGTGPGTLAALVYRLLVDITAPAARSIDQAPDGLTRLFQRKMPAGTVLTRQQLEAARDEDNL
jgi:hypothetical protein